MSESSERDKLPQTMEAVEVEEVSGKLFADILQIAKQQMRLFEEPYQLKFKLAN
jgi:hypothetical protein